jgi:hypothetical protein
MADKKPKPSLEEIAMEYSERKSKHKLDQIIPSLMEAFVKHPGVKYKDKSGVEHYKTKFNEEEKIAIADKIFDTLAYHANLRFHSGMTPRMYEDLKKIKDPSGESYTDNMVNHLFGITRLKLRQNLAEAEEITPELVYGLAENTFKKHHENVVKSKILTKVQMSGYTKDDIQKFVGDKVKEYGLKVKDYRIKKEHGIEDALDIYGNLAEKYKELEKKKVA